MLLRPSTWALSLLSVCCAVGCVESAAVQAATTAAPVANGKAALAAPPMSSEEVRRLGSFANGYAIGRNLRERIKGDNLDIDFDQLIEGFSGGVRGATSKLTDAQLQQALEAFGQRQAALAKAAADKRVAETNAFMAENGKKTGVRTTSSGLQYLVLKGANGKSPKPSSQVVVHYEGKLADGKVFDSSIKRGMPAEFRVDGVIPGWQEALPLMKKGEKWRLWIPPNLAYGERGVPGIPPNAMLTFDVELIDIKDDEKSGPTHNEHKNDLSTPGE